MSTSVSSVVSHFPSAENGFTTTTSGSVSSGATTVGLNSVAGYTNGEIAVFVIDPTDASKKQTFTGTIDTSGVQVTDVVWTAGTNQTHALGATVVDYATATHISMMTKGILVEHEQDGTHGVELITSRTEDTSPDLDSDFLLSYDTSAAALKKVKPSNILGAGWSNLEDTPDTVTYNGNRSYDLVFNGNDLTDTVSNGMRLKLTRTVTAPTQCADLEQSSSQYFVKTSPNKMTFTDDFTCMAWIKLESYGTTSYIISRHNGTTGWYLRVNTTGELQIAGTHTTGTATDLAVSTQAVPLNKWVHVAASLDMSGASGLIYIDGVLVPSTYTNGAQSSLTQAGNLEVGSLNGGTFCDAKLAQVAVFGAVLSASTIRSYASQTLSGSETNLLSAYSFNNSIVDLNSTTPNDLTAQGSAVATATDTPFAGGSVGTTEYGIITANTFSTNTTLTVQVPEGYAIPTSGGVSAVAYSTQDVPYGFPRNRGKWTVEFQSIAGANLSQATSVDTWYNIGSYQLSVPIGAWRLGYKAAAYANDTSGTSAQINVSLSTSTSAEGTANFATYSVNQGATGNLATVATMTASDYVAVTSATIYYLVEKTAAAGVDSIRISQSINSTITAEFAYV